MKIQIRLANDMQLSDTVRPMFVSDTFLWNKLKITYCKSVRYVSGIVLALSVCLIYLFNYAQKLLQDCCPQAGKK